MAAVREVNGEKVQAGRSFSIASSLQCLSQPSSPVHLSADPAAAKAAQLSVSRSHPWRVSWCDSLRSKVLVLMFDLQRCDQFEKAISLCLTCVTGKGLGV